MKLSLDEDTPLWRIVALDEHGNEQGEVIKLKGTLIDAMAAAQHIGDKKGMYRVQMMPKKLRFKEKRIFPQPKHE